VEPVLLRHFEHPQVNLGVLLSREADEANLPRLARFFHRFVRAVLAEDPVGVLHTEHFVVLNEVDHVGA
jgi:hypothetical protein